MIVLLHYMKFVIQLSFLILTFYFILFYVIFLSYFVLTIHTN